MLTGAHVIISSTKAEKDRAFLRDVKKFGITQLREGQPLDAFEKHYLEPRAKN